MAARQQAPQQRAGAARAASGRMGQKTRSHARVFHNACPALDLAT